MPPQFGRALHLGTLILVRRPHLLTLCQLAVHLAHQPSVPSLPAGRGGAPRVYREESLLLLAILRARKLMVSGELDAPEQQHARMRLGYDEPPSDAVLAALRRVPSVGLVEREGRAGRVRAHGDRSCRVSGSRGGTTENVL